MEGERMEGMDSLKKDIRIYLFIKKAPKISVLFYLFTVKSPDRILCWESK